MRNISRDLRTASHFSRGALCRFDATSKSSGILHPMWPAPGAVLAQDLFQAVELVGSLQEAAEALGPHRQGLAGASQAERVGRGTGRPHRPIASAGTDAEAVGEGVREDRLELHALAASGLGGDRVRYVGAQQVI